MSLPNEQQQLKLVALAARFAATSRRWDPDGDILEELNDVVTSAESLKRINPTDEPLTEESLAVRLKHLDDITQKEPLKILEVKDTDSPSDQHLIKRSLTNLKHYGDQGRASPSTGFHFTKNSTESDVNIVGIWIAARPSSIRSGYWMIFGTPGSVMATTAKSFLIPQGLILLPMEYFVISGFMLDLNGQHPVYSAVRRMAIRPMNDLQELVLDIENVQAARLLYFICGSLPWQGRKAASEEEKGDLIKDMKTNTSASSLCEGLPEEFATFGYVRSLGFEDRPDNAYLRRLFDRLFVSRGFKHDNGFDWTEKRFNELHGLAVAP
ncbi:casein kinase I isoform delta [Purpureocillium lavendulum]|uniref:Casein kinase I isoform delta n=1 Tax=Purpureocillium lavendulum TaxID=1247861 RepID=A0AB34FBB2_9HYPO|nr:casein kinase I isoform delta [Purpureocillium lavendulum]